MEEVRGFSAAVGRRVRALRDAHGVTADQVADAARRYGFAQWQRSTVALVESGRRGLSAEELVLLPEILSKALGTRVRLGELLTESAELTPLAKITPEGFRRVLKGRPVGDELLLTAAGVRQAFAASTERIKELRSTLPNVRVDLFERAEEDAAGEAEQKAGRRLGYNALQVSVAAHMTFKQGFTAERDARVAGRIDTRKASPRSIQAARGAVSRQLIEELRPVLDKFPKGE